MHIRHLVCAVVTLSVLSFAVANEASAGDTVRVVSAEATIRLNKEETSAAVAVVKIGTVLEVQSHDGDWYGVLLPPDPSGVARFGYVSGRDVERFVWAPSSDRPAQPGMVAVPPTPARPDTTLAGLQGLLKEGTTLIVYDALQHQRRVTFRGATANALQVARTGDKDWRPVWAASSSSDAFEGEEIPAEQILRIEEERRDGLGRGVGIGFAVGGGLALLGATGVGCKEEYGVGRCLGAGMLIYALPAMAIGAIIDASVRERVMIYESSRSSSRLSVAPLVGRRGIRAQLVWSF